MKPIISGIQQIGVGNNDVYGTFKWYHEHLGMDVKIFDEAAEAALMLPYTGGVARSRHAILALNMQGGGGLEIWQYTSRTPEAPTFQLQLGDLGIYIMKFKCKNVAETYQSMKGKGVNLCGGVSKAPNGLDHFYFKDLHGNLVEVVPSDNWFRKNNSFTGGVYGCTIGVSDIEKAREVYSDIIGYDEVVYDETGTFEDFASLDGGNQKFRRVLLTHSKPRIGAFSQLLGKSEIELVQVLDRTPKKIFENRLWGDLGYIHLCFDINGMKELQKLCESKGRPFTCDSSDSFDMGEAAGHFSYIEDPDGTLIEFVETHKVPILKKINWYMDLRNRDPKKSLPTWMVRALGFNRVKI
ncbi:MAG: catechol 2,3-dioxygenase-like lactoylglutathione lyase family enzyme [Polaribacter sp.]|jgi:catechol 2,3-dioxygenase-like lactoylglutathione lyase family enzyme